MLKKLFADPLVHFIIIGAAIFAIYAYVDQNEAPERERILVSEERLLQLAAIHERTWQRQPTPDELQALAEAYVKEEVYYREALRLGLDRDDTIVRRRLQQKLEFLNEPDAEVLVPSDDELEKFMAGNAVEYKVLPAIAFRQILLDPTAIEGRDRADIFNTLNSAQGEALIDEIAQPSLLPEITRLSPLNYIARDFGQAFAGQLAELAQNRWVGPISSSYGDHLVQVTEARPAYVPSLSEVRSAVERDWRVQARQDFQDEAYNSLRAQYNVIFPESIATKPAENGQDQ